MKKHRSILAAVFVIASFIFSGWTLTHQGDVPGGRHFIKKYWDIYSSNDDQKNGFESWMFGQVALYDFEGIISYRYHFEGDQSDIERIQQNFSKAWESQFQKKSSDIHKQNLVSWLFSNSDRPEKNLEVFVLPYLYAKDRDIALNREKAKDAISALPMLPIPGNKKTYQNLAVKFEWAKSDKEQLTLEHFVRINRTEDIDFRYSGKKGKVYFIRLRSEKGKPILIHREKWIGSPENQELISELVFPTTQETISRMPASVQDDDEGSWKQDVGFYGSVKLEDQTIAYYANVDQIVIDRKENSLKHINVTKIELMGKGTELKPEEQKQLEEKVHDLLSSLPLKKIHNSLKLDRLIKNKKLN